MVVRILIDGIPYSLINSLYKGGRLENCQKPVKLISTFPTLTEPAYSAIFSDETTSCYGAIQFDKYKKHLKIRRKDEIKKINFDFKQPDTRYLFEALTKASKISKRNFFVKLFSVLRHLSRFFLKNWKTYIDFELEKAQKYIITTNKEVVTLILDSFDEYCHREGLEKTRDKLLDFFCWLENIQKIKPFDFILFSDHGNTPTKYNYINYSKLLKKAGFSVTTRLYKRKDILIPLYVSVSFFPIYCSESISLEVATFLSMQKGVDIVFLKENNGIIKVISNNKISEVISLHDGHYYKIISGDTLFLRDIIQNNGLELTSNGYFTDDWFSLTFNHIYPNPLERIVKSFDNVKVPARILVSLNDDTVYGYPISHKLYNAVCMHGNFSKESSEAFILKSNGYNYTCDDVMNIYNFKLN